MESQTLVVTFEVGRVGREVVCEVIGAVADVVFLPEINAAERADVLRRADVLLARHRCDRANTSDGESGWHS